MSALSRLYDPRECASRLYERGTRFAKARGEGRRALELVNRVLIEFNTRLLVITAYARKTRSLKGIVEGEEALEIRIRSREEPRESGRALQRDKTQRRRGR